MSKRFLIIIFFLGFFTLPYKAEAFTRDIAFPVLGDAHFRNDFAESRAGGAREHLGIDIIAAKMTPVVSAVDGTVSYIVSPQASWGYSISIRDSEGYSYRYLHLNNDTPGTDDGGGGEEYAYASGIRRGTHVTKGQVIGWVGDSGNAEDTVAHLHFEIRDPKRTPINPYESLIAVKPEAQETPVILTSSIGVVAEEFVFTKYLIRSMHGEEVRKLQAKLAALGYFEESPTGYFGVLTEEAIRDFQRAEGIEPLGIVGPQTRAALNQALSFTFNKTLSEGSREEEVQELQKILQKLGYFTETPTGYFGSITRLAVIKFQSDKGLEPVGIVGPQTRAALNAF